jgi:hypothetical protein
MRDSIHKVRSLHKLIPELAKANLLRQLVEAKRIVASTFMPSDDMRATLRNIPQNYLEEIYRVYSAQMYRAYEQGVATLEMSPLQVPEAEFVKAVKARLPLAESIAQELTLAFQEGVKKFIDTMTNKADILSAFKVDLEEAYLHGAIDQFMTTHATPADSLKDSPLNPQAPAVQAPEANPATVEAAAADFMKSLEAYTKLLKDPTAERVLRYTLGLPVKGEAPAAPKPATAAADESAVEEQPEVTEQDGDESGEFDGSCGPYDSEELRQKTLDLVKGHQADADEDTQVVVVDCLVSEISEMSEQELATALAKKLEIEEDLSHEFTDYGLSEVEELADAIAEDLTALAGLPGEFVFVDHGDNFCLLFCYNSVQAGEMAKMAGAIATAAKKESKLPAGPGGALSVKDQKEIESLAQLGSMRKTTMKQLKKASQRLANDVSTCLSKARSNGLSLGEVADLLKSDLDSHVERVFGMDGLDYLKHVRGKLKK